jgi:hypothetical protein
MTNFSSFFPTAAAGGGGFTKMNKYVTERSADDATHKLPPATFLGRQFTNLAIGATGLTQFQLTTPSSYITSENEIVGGTFVHNGTTHTITANTAYDNSQAGFNLTFTPGLTATMAGFSYVTITNPTSFTINPATDLGLSDGDSIGYFLVGGAWKRASSTYGAMGGKITQGTAIISNASTDLILTPGDGKEGGSYATSAAPGESTISGGLTITSADGHSRSGSAGRQSNFAPGYGINGYGQGTVPYNDSPNSQLVQDVPYHGFGSGVSTTASRFGSDGAILIFY